jgi:DNA-binding SARP family transcriptional activator/TolB-like protein
VDSTFTLRLLGGMALYGRDGVVTGRATQRRRLAVLALIALAPHRVLSRDKLLALLWPEGRDEDTRHRLSVALYELRRVLGDGALVTLGDDVRLSDNVACDVLDFEAALRRGDAASAVRLYAGAFLDGVHIDGSPEFEEWSTGVRDRLQRAWHGALEGLARQQAVAGELTGAVERWRELARAEPFSGRIALGLMDALAAAGDRGAAVLHADAHAALLRAELGIDPDPEVTGLAQRLRLTRSTAAQAATGPGDVVQSRAAAEPEPAGSTAAGGGSGPAMHRVQPRWRRLLGAAGLTAAVAALTLLGSLAAARDPGDVEPPAANRIAVLPFAVNGSAEHAYLAGGMVDLLSAALDGAGELRTVDPYALHSYLARTDRGATPADAAPEVAAHFAAGRFIVGSVFVAGGRIRMHATLFAAPGEGRTGMSAMVEGVATDVLQLVDELAARLIARDAVAPGQRPARVAALTTHSLPALRAWLAGEAHFRAGHFVAAADSFRSAGEQDSTFALAHYRLALAALWADQEGVSTADADARALRHDDRLGRRDRLLLHAFGAWRSGDAATAESLYREVLDAHTDDVEAWFQLGETLFHYNPLRGRPAGEAVTAFERVLLLDPAHRGAAWHLALLAAHRQDRSELGRLASQLARAANGAPSIELATLRAAFNVQDRPDAWEDMLEAPAATPLQRSAAAWRTAVFFRQWGVADRLLRQDAASSSAYWRSVARTGRADLMLAAGRFAAADTCMEYLLRSGGVPQHALERLILPAVTPGFARPPTVLHALEARLGGHVRAMQSRGGTEAAAAPTTHAYLGGLLRAALGDTAAVRRHVVALQRLDAAAPDDVTRAFAATLRAHLARAAGRPDDALRELDAHTLRRWYGHTVTSPVQAHTHERFLRAELLAELGREREALLWYAGFGEHALHDLVFLAPAHFRSAEIHERLDEPQHAARHYVRVVELWAGADDELQPLVAEARRRTLRLNEPPRDLARARPVRR